MNNFQTIEDVWKYLNAIPMFQNTGIQAANFSLDNIRHFCDRLDRPQDKFPSIHIAGTNGKGTTAYLLEEIYSKSGYKTGMFTSPHLLRYNERVRVNQQEISNHDILAFFQESEHLFDEISLSYFEISTALAFWYFAREEVGIAIIEVGLGGRLDSTNIIQPEVCVITSIGLDHQNILGETLGEIAREKAGIIKENVPVVLGNIPFSALPDIIQMANQKYAAYHPTEMMHPQFEKGRITLNNGTIQLHTHFQEAVNKWNVACAWQVVQLLSTEFPIKQGVLQKNIENFRGVPGRFEKLHQKYDWFFSGSHNPQALESSLRSVELLKPISETVLVFSAMKDKIRPKILSKLKGFKKIYFFEQDGERAAKFSEINRSLPAILLDENSKEIILNELKTELVIFMGSFYFYPTVKRWIANDSL